MNNTKGNTEESKRRVWFEERLLERLLRYVRIDTASDRNAEVRPTTDGQWKLARELLAELQAMGVGDASIDEHCFLLARLDARQAFRTKPSLALVAHLDTTGDVSGSGVKPQVHCLYDGKPIRIADGVVLDPEEFPDLSRYRGETIITAGGDTLLGADNKAGIAEIMTAAEYLLSHPEIPRGHIEIVFTPDEETGFGMDLFPLDRLRSKTCYTVDGSEEGVIETECFEAYCVEVAFRGRSMHTGSARGKMINAVELASSFIGMLPREESPQATDDRYGFYCPTGIRGTVESADVQINIRDFEETECLRRLDCIRTAAAALEALYPGCSVTVEAKHQYGNMKGELERRPEVAGRLEQAIRETGLEPQNRIIRGGTDGARLTAMGVPTPNLFTGGHNFHSLLEWAALPAMARASQTLVHLARIWAESGSERPAAD